MRHVVEGVAGVGAAAFPLADDVVALGDQIRRAPEVEVGERAGTRGELAHLVAAAARGVQRVLEADVRGGELVDDRGLKSLPQNSVNQRPTMALFSSVDTVRIPS